MLAGEADGRFGDVEDDGLRDTKVLDEGLVRREGGEQRRRVVGGRYHCASRRQSSEREEAQRGYPLVRAELSLSVSWS